MINPNMAANATGWEILTEIDFRSIKLRQNEIERQELTQDIAILTQLYCESKGSHDWQYKGEHPQTGKILYKCAACGVTEFREE